MAQNENLGLGPHNHAECRKRALSAARLHCAQRGVKLTPVRERTLEILTEAHVALGAYDLLARLEAEGFGAKPPVAYRALNFLVEHGLAHKIERLNAFVACAHPDEMHDPAFMICRGCGHVGEGVRDEALDACAAAAGFHMESAVIEVEGLCSVCHAEQSPC